MAQITGGQYRSTGQLAVGGGTDGQAGDVNRVCTAEGALRFRSTSFEERSFGTRGSFDSSAALFK